MPFAATADGTVHYEIDGRGPGLVLVHGAGGDAERVFGSFMAAFVDDRTVIRPNLSGSGKTTDGGGALTLPQLTGQVVAAAREAADGPVELLGFSLGAVVAAATAATHPELVRRLILVSGCAHVRRPREVLQFQVWRAVAEADDDLFKRLATLQCFSPDILDGFGHEGLSVFLDDDWPPGVARQVEVSAHLDIRPLLSAVRVPTLVIGFADDQVIPSERTYEMHRDIPGSRFEQLPGGHLDWLVKPEQMIALTRAFLEVT
jgi:pimeloyl-ACP methyl ester carboxylesterase